MKLAGSTNDHPLFAAGAAPGELWGKPIYLSTEPLTEWIMQVLRLVERYAPHVGLLPFGRFGGDVRNGSSFPHSKDSGLINQVVIKIFRG